MAPISTLDLLRSALKSSIMFHFGCGWQPSYVKESKEELKEEKREDRRGRKGLKVKGEGKRLLETIKETL